MKKKIGELFGKAIVSGGGDITLQKHKLKKRHEILLTDEMLKMLKDGTISSEASQDIVSQDILDKVKDMQLLVVLIAPKNKEAVPDLTNLGETAYATVVGKYNLADIVQTKAILQKQFETDGVVPIITDSLENVGYYCLSMAIISSDNDIEVGQELAQLPAVNSYPLYFMNEILGGKITYENGWIQTIGMGSGIVEGSTQFFINVDDWYTIITIPINIEDGINEVINLPVCIPQVQYTNLDVPETSL